GGLGSCAGERGLLARRADRPPRSLLSRVRRRRRGQRALPALHAVAVGGGAGGLLPEPPLLGALPVLRRAERPPARRPHRSLPVGVLVARRHVRALRGHPRLDRARLPPCLPADPSDARARAIP